jgi:hypothetical protein
MRKKRKTCVIYPRLGLRPPFGYDINWFRLGGVGLGNLLLTWARAEVLAKQFSLPILAPAFSQLCLGPIRRRERDWRTYNGMFQRDPNFIYGITRLWYLLKTKRIAESEISSIDSQADSYCVQVEGIEGLFRPIRGHEDFIRARLTEIVNPIYSFPIMPRTGVIGVHIRLGDFNKLGWSTPIDWFATQVSNVTREHDIKSIEIYSDAKDKTIFEAIKQAGRGLHVSDKSELPAITSIMRLASCGFLVGSNRSTFSMWAAYLGKANIRFPDPIELVKSGLGDK